MESNSRTEQDNHRSIAEMSRERLQRVARTAEAGASSMSSALADVGFRAFRIDSTNMTDTFRPTDGMIQGKLGEFEDSVKPDRNSDDLVFQVLLDWGLELSLPILADEICRHEVLDVDDGALIACFDSSVDLGVVRSIADRQPLRAVFRDSAFESDDARINAEQIFREVSPDTDVRVI